MTPETLTLNIAGLLCVGVIVWRGFSAHVRWLHRENSELNRAADVAWEREMGLKRDLAIAEERAADAERELAAFRAVDSEPLFLDERGQP